MKSELEYKVNKHISLKLQRNRARVYIDNTEILICKKIAFNIPVSKLDDIKEIKAIDDLENVYYTEIDENNEMLKKEKQITPEVEFFVHCSNIEAWAQNGYDTRLIHSNLAFPLLKRLSRVGDIQAKKVFKEEIVKQYLEGNEKVQEFLASEDYLSLLNSEEREFLLGERAQKIREIETILGRKIDIVGNIETRKVGIELFQGEVNGFGNTGKNMIFIPEEIKSFKSLKKLILNNFLDTNLPEWVSNLNKIEIMNLSNNKIKSLPYNIGNLTNLKSLNLRNNKINSLPKSTSNLKNLEDIILSKNKFEELPLELCSLPKLRNLSLNKNYIKVIPLEIKHLTHLRELDLGDNPLEEVPEDLLNLPSIELIILPFDSVFVYVKEARKKNIRIIWKKSD